MRDADDLEPAGEALGQSLFDEQGRRSQQDHPQPAPGPGVLVPQALDRLRPAGGLLDLVDHEHGAGGPGLEPRRLPLRRDPLRATERGLVGAHNTDRGRQPLDRLGDQRRLARLPWPGDHLDEPPGLGEAAGQLGRLGRRYGDAGSGLLTMLSSLAQDHAECKTPLRAQAQAAHPVRAWRSPELEPVEAPDALPPKERVDGRAREARLPAQDVRPGSGLQTPGRSCRRAALVRRSATTAESRRGRSGLPGSPLPGGAARSEVIQKPRGPAS